jgi:hypothetical protein
VQVAGSPVAAGPSGLLIVRLHRARKVVVDHEADVALVDAKAERVGRDDRLELVGHEAVLRRLAVCRRHLAVVQADGELILEQFVQAALPRAP